MERAILRDKEKMQFFKQVNIMRKNASKMVNKSLDRMIKEAMDFAKRKR